MTKKETIQFYQELSTNAWPPKSSILLSGWILRISEGITKRANSVLPLSYFGENLLVDIEQVEKLFQETDLPIIFQLSDYFEPKNLLEQLLELNYEIIDESLLMIAEIEKINEISLNKSFLYSHIIEESTSWFDAYSMLTKCSPERMIGNKAIIDRIKFPKGFFFAKHNDQIVGIALAVIERENIGSYDMIVHSDYRRQEIAQSLIKKIFDWGKELYVKGAYLQVQGDNSGAISLYKKVGYKECYRYRYLIKR